MSKVLFVFLIIVTIVSWENNLGAQENLILRTDRNIYISGEELWLELNCVSTGSNNASGLSTVAYVELLNANNNPVLQKTFLLDQGTASTHLIIPDTLATGNYMLRAYTNWMKNYNPHLYAYKSISLINPFKDNDFPDSDVPFTNDTVFFYPESEKLLTGRNNRLLLQILDKYAMPISCRAYLLDSNNDTLTILQTNQAGFAKIEFTPLKNVNYHLAYTSGNKTHLHLLPVTKNQGYVLSLQSTDNQILLTPITADTIAEKVAKIDITDSYGDFIKSLKTQDTNTIEVNKNELPSGFLCAHAYDNSDMLLASRYFVANNTKNIQTKLTLNKQNYSCREKVNLNIENLSHLKKVSIAVTPTALARKQSWIEHPKKLNTYSPNNLLLWTGGGITLNDLLQCFHPLEYVKMPGPVTFLPEHEGKILSGTIKNGNQQVISEETFMLNIVGEKSTIDLSTTDSLGRFNFVVNEFGDKEIVIQPLLQSDSTVLDYTIDVEESFSKQFTEPALSNFALSKSDIECIDQAIVNMQIKALYKQDNAMDEHIVDAVQSSFYGTPEYSIPLSKFIDLSTMEEIIRELVPSVSLSMKKGRYIIEINEPDGLVKSEGETFLLVDGVYINDINRVLQIPSSQVERIDLINLNYFYEGKKLGRIFATYTKNAKLSDLDFDDRIFRQAQSFYEAPAQFIPTEYNLVSKPGKRTPDFRNLLYWQTNVTSPNIEFYTSDATAKYSIILQGINNQGSVESYRTTFNVE